MMNCKDCIMTWYSSYQSKKKTPEEATSIIKNGNKVYLSANAAAPCIMMQALAKRGEQLENVELFHMLLIGKDFFAGPNIREKFFHSSFFVGSADRESVNSGLSAYIPVHLHEIPRFYKEGYLPLDVAIIHTSPPDEHGFMSLGVEVVATKAAVEKAKYVIAQVNQQMPRVLGDSFVHVSQVHAVVEVDDPLLTLPKETPSEVERKIGKYIADLIEDGSTLQLGIGGIPNAVLELLEGKRDIGIHTEMVSDGILEVLEKGIVTGRKKTIHNGKVIGTFVLGSRKLYDYVNNNPMFEIHPVDYTNDPFVIAKNERMVAINSAIEIDLTGQVCADSIGTYMYSGFGGQVDFIRGAGASKYGKPIIAMGSSAKNDQITKIVPKLKEGSGVVTSRADVHYVVTEFGVAHLYSKNLHQRAQEMIRIAHPNFREQLEKAAWERKILPRSYAAKFVK